MEYFKYINKNLKKVVFHQRNIKYVHKDYSNLGKKKLKSIKKCYQ